MKNTNQIKLLNFYKDLYSTNINELNTENNLRWICLISYLTVIAGLTGYTFYLKEVVCFLGLLFIQIGWLYGVIIKNLLLEYCELNGKYLEIVMNKILEKWDIDLFKPKVVRFTDLHIKLQGDYRKPLTHPFSGFIYFYYSLPVIIYFSIYAFTILEFKRLNNIFNIPFNVILWILGVLFLVTILILIFYLRAENRMRKEFDQLINKIK